MRDQDALGAGLADLDLRLDRVAAAAYIWCDIGRHMAHAGVKGETLARAMEARRVLREARAEAVIERQHLMLLRLLPPAADHIGKAHGLLACEIVSLREILREMIAVGTLIAERPPHRTVQAAFPHT